MLELVVRLVIGGVVVAGGLLLWYRASRGGLNGGSGPVLRVAARAGLTRSALVAVIDVDGRRYLVGAAEEGVRLLAELGPATGSPADAPDQPDDSDGVVAPDALAGLAPASSPASMLHAIGVHGRDTDQSSGPRIGPLDRLRAMTVRSHQREPIRDQPLASE